MQHEPNESLPAHDADAIEVAVAPTKRLWLDRRHFLTLGGVAAMSAVLAACGSDSDSTDAASAETTAGSAETTGATAETSGAATAETTGAATAETTGAAADTTPAAAGGANAAKFGGGGGDGTLKIGFTAPLTGPLAGFGEANDFTLKTIKDLTKDGLMIGSKSYKVEIIVADVQSNSDTAASQAGKLITDDGVDMIIAMATPEMVNPVADQCEANGIPCLSTLAPWQPYFLGRKGDPAKGFDWTYHFFWGADQLVGVFSKLWDTAPDSKVIGLLCANDPDGAALSDPKTGFPAGIAAAGKTLVDPGRFQALSDDFSAVISELKSKNAEVLAGVPLPPDFATFWQQAQQQGYKPKVVTMAKAILFPNAVAALPNSGDGLASEVWWSPNHPFSSSLTTTSAKDLSDQYTTDTKKQWTQFVGFVHALFEVAFDSVSRAGSTDKKAIAEAFGSTKLDTIVGPISFGQDGRPKNIAATPLVGGQWQKTSGGQFPIDLVIVDNTQAPNIPKGGDMKPLEYS
jgi:branched-chain amino acid transport system substrate-binding protein